MPPPHRAVPCPECECGDPGTRTQNAKGVCFAAAWSNRAPSAAGRCSTLTEPDCSASSRNRGSLTSRPLDLSIPETTGESLAEREAPPELPIRCLVLWTGIAAMRASAGPPPTARSDEVVPSGARRALGVAGSRSAPLMPLPAPHARTRRRAATPDARISPGRQARPSAGRRQQDPGGVLQPPC